MVLRKPGDRSAISPAARPRFGAWNRAVGQRPCQFPVRARSGACVRPEPRTAPADLESGSAPGMAKGALVCIGRDLRAAREFFEPVRLQATGALDRVSVERRAAPTGG